MATMQTNSNLDLENSSALASSPRGNTTTQSSTQSRKARVRVSRACDRCKSKKIRCSGKRPCTLCKQLNLPCLFNARYNRGQVPTIEDGESEAEVDSLAQSIVPTTDSVENCAPETPPSTVTGQSLQQERLPVAETHHSGIVSNIHSSRNSPEPSQTDLEGHYVGPSSGVSFLLRAQKRLHKIVSLSPNSSIFTFGDTPLPISNSNLFILPPKDQADALIARYFDFAVPTHRFLHRPTVEAWGEELYNNLGAMQDQKGGIGKRAVLFMVFAQAEEYMPHGNHEDCRQSARYFDAAEHQLRSETGEIRLTSVQARLAQCFYLLSESRINHCWSLFGTTAHLALALGIHRKRRRDGEGSMDMIDAECRKRVFWSAYTLDTYLSTALGRPRTFHNDDIDQELPTLASDSELTAASITPSISKSQSIMLAPVHHIRLARIISNILRDLYSIRPIRTEARNAVAQKYSSELELWRQKIAHFLDADSSLMDGLFRRQNNVLRLAHAHACILVHRPSLLSNFADLTRQSQRRTNEQVNTEDNVSECLKAAMSIVTIVNELHTHGQIFRAFWFTHYYAFCAVVVLYVYTIQRRSDPQPTWAAYFDAASRCQQQIHGLRGQKDSLAQRYSIVLEELRIEASNKTKKANRSINVITPDGSNPQGLAKEGNNRNGRRKDLVSEEVQQTGHGLRSAPKNSGFYSVSIPSNDSYPKPDPPYINATASFDLIDQLDVSCDIQNLSFPDSMTNDSPASMLDNWTGWGEFDSFVTSGVIGPGDSHGFYGGEQAMDGILEGTETQRDGDLGGWGYNISNGQ